ncbi:hypothetical protein FB45DRAFT_1064375 [Roridomyces roridus]|uniref:F-box domain-containing protein n=1 Tax=Roridomyces roridus TaxID=1738132 RepID=A0AAD7FEF6_9AGAR|nr:hypothetical protein FB45DRAFT_1064375 [Roridomyces roridus]
MAMLRARLAHIDEQVAALESQMALLRRDRKIVQDELAAIVYPILTLPDDVTSGIFLQYADDYPTQICSPMVLASICTQWREVALATNGLWTRFSAGHFYVRSSQKLVHFPDLLRMWLSRSGALPLDLRIPLPSSTSTIPSREAIVRLLFEYSSQWGSMQLSSPESIELPRDIEGGSFPSLTHLSLYSHHAVAPIPSFLDAPRLRIVKLAGLTLVDHWRDSLPSLPWGQLTNLEMQIADLGECLDILEHTQMLEVLGFTLNVDLEQVPPRGIILHHVHTLVLCGQPSHGIIPHLTLPALRRLGIEMVTSEYTPAIESLIERSGCPLTMVSLDDMHDVHAIAALLRTIRTTQEVQLKLPMLDEDGFSRLFKTIADDPSLLPALTTLEITKCMPGTIELSPLADMLVRRSGQRGEFESTKLESFKLLFREPSGYDDFLPEWNFGGRSDEVARDIGRVRELRAGGLGLEIRPTVPWLNGNVTAEMAKALCGPL